MQRPRSRRSFLAVGVVTALLLVVPAAPGMAAPNGAALKVLTRNLYLGADLAPILAVPSPELLPLAVADAWATVQQTNFPERAEALADEIAETNPHVVGLQEAELWRTQTPADFGSSLAVDVAFDFLTILLTALGARGLHYSVAASVTNFDVEAPALDFASPNFLTDIRLTDRDAILVRTDLPSNVFSVSNPQGANFDENLVLGGPFGGLEILRGWTSVDAVTPAGTVRVVNTHLEPFSIDDQVAQGEELLEGPADTELPVILLGDLNSAADGTTTPTYGNILEDGSFVDAWSVRRGDDPGLTCCHAEDLLNVEVTFTERIDYVLFRGAIGVGSVACVGHELVDRTPSGLWPSDHAGVRAVLLVG